MKKNKRTIILSIILVCVAALAITIGVLANNSTHSPSKELVYSVTYSFEMGVRRVQIYDNGEVYDDLEIEEPNHEVNYGYVKTLSAEQIRELNNKKANGASDKELSDYVIKTVYGVEKFDSHGGY